MDAPVHFARGKVILLGEHAVVHGHPALAAALDRGVRCAAVAAAAPGLRLRLPDWQIDVGPADDHPVAPALAAIARAAGAEGAAFALEASADLPVAAGLGSSAALSVAVARALLAATGQNAPAGRVAAIADAGERCFHANPSGVDVALAAGGGAGLYRRGAGLRSLAAPPIELVIGLSGEPRRTAAMVEHVSAALAARPAEVGARLETLGDAARRGADAWLAGDTAALGAEMDGAQRELAALELSTPGLDAMIGAARASGALGAKLTGAGGGGAMIALAPDRDSAGVIAAALRALEKEALVCRVGAQEPPA